jgi:hypothetical protein
LSLTLLNYGHSSKEKHPSQESDGEQEDQVQHYSTEPVDDRSENEFKQSDEKDEELVEQLDEKHLDKMKSVSRGLFHSSSSLLHLLDMG